MLFKLLLCFTGFVAVWSYPYVYKTEKFRVGIEYDTVWSYPYINKTEKFRVGIEYDKSLPMNGGSDRYRHRNNLDPFYVTITTTAKKGFVISYMDVSTTVAENGEVDFQLIRGSTGSKTMAFQLVSNNSDFLSFQYLAYGIREEEYQKITNIINLPIGNSGSEKHIHLYAFIFIIYQILRMLL